MATVCGTVCFPYDEIEGENALRFGKFSKVISDLTYFEAKAGRQKTLREWADFLDSLTDRFSQGIMRP